jgi:hypothetical protein
MPTWIAHADWGTAPAKRVVATAELAGIANFATWLREVDPSAELFAVADAVIVEAYPADAYLRLGLRIGSRGTAKTSRDDRRADAAPCSSTADGMPYAPMPTWSQSSAMASARPAPARTASTRPSA